MGTNETIFVGTMGITNRFNYFGCSFNSDQKLTLCPFSKCVLFCFPPTCRSDPHPITRGGHQVSLLLPDFNHGAERGGVPRPVPWPHHPPGAPDPQHRHHDVHLRAGGLHPEWLNPVTPRVIHSPNPPHTLLDWRTKDPQQAPTPSVEEDQRFLSSS